METTGSTSLLESLHKTLWFSLAFFLPLSTAISIFFLVCALLFELSVSQAEWKWAVNHPVFRSLWALLLLVTLGCFWTESFTTDTFTAIKKYGKWLLLPFLLMRLEGQKNVIFAGFACGAAVTAVCGMLKFHGYLPWMTAYSPAAAFKSHIQSNFVMALAAWGAFLAYFYNKTSPQTHRRQVTFIVFFLIASVYVWFYSEGRSGYISYLAMGSYILSTLFAHKKKMLLGVLCVLGFAVAHTSPVLQKRIEQIPAEFQNFLAGDSASSTGERITFAKESMRVFMHSPYWGHGTGSFRASYEQYADPSYPPTSNPHNEYLLIAVQWGVLGLLCCLGVFSRIFWLASALSPFEKHLMRGTLVLFAVGALFNSWLFDSTQSYTLLLLVATCFSARAKEDYDNKALIFNHRHHL